MHILSSNNTQSAVFNDCIIIIIIIFLIFLYPR